MSPNDPFDYDGVNEWIIADLAIGGSPHKVIMQANRNGFLYVIDRTTGKVLTANPFVKVTWADRIDPTTGRPVWSEDTKRIVENGGKVRVYPSVSGGKNWAPMSFNLTTGLLYVNTLDFGMDYETAPAEQIANLKPGQPHYGVKFPRVFDPDKRGYLRAIDPLTGKAKWEVPFKSPNIAGTLVTAGGLVFTGQQTGEFMAFDSGTGNLLWQFQTPSGIVGQPITWERDGKQYVTITSGIGGVYALKSGDPNLAHVPAGGTLWTFKLFEQYTPQRTTSVQ
jgi:alcohol dehydrogenase (cytochrome c)